mgnify:CR=1 FL=1
MNTNLESPKYAVDFDRIDAADFLENLNIKNISIGLDEIVFSCPFTEYHKNGDRNPSASMNINNKLICCFGCKYGGNPITFLAKLEGISYVLAEKYIVERYGGKNLEGLSVADYFKAKMKTTKEIIEEVTQISTPKNKVIPWGFAEQMMEALEGEPLQYVCDRGFTLDTIQRFELGYDVKSDRVVIPVLDEDDQLLGFKGRSYKEHTPPPKYLVIGDRTGSTWGFGTVNVQHEIFNIAGLSSDEPVVVVEGEFDAMKIWQNGYRNVCALYGSTFTDEQCAKLHNVSNEFILFLDSDKAGNKCKEKIINTLGPSCIIHVVDEHEGDPCDMTKEECISLIENAKSPFKQKLMKKEMV